MTDMIHATAQVPTTHGGKYLQQLCKHWSHNLAVDYDAAQGRVTFPRNARGADWAADGVVRFVAHPETLDVTVTASGAEHLAALQGVVASHIDRFAFREAPLTFDWR